MFYDLLSEFLCHDEAQKIDKSSLIHFSKKNSFLWQYVHNLAQNYTTLYYTNYSRDF